MDAVKLNALVEKCQAVMVDYLRPDGIDAAAAIDLWLGLLDGPEQREAQGVAECCPYCVAVSSDTDHLCRR